jgi:phytoene dehydrogenase-like protein
MSGRPDAVVIGGSMGGLIASAYLRQTGAIVVLLEGAEMLGGACRSSETFHALDPRVVKDMGLGRHGLKFALRDMALVALRQDGRHLVLGRDPHDAARAIAAHSPADAAAYKRYQSELFALARTLRPWWWDDAAEPRGLPARVEAASAQAFLASYFESDAVRTALAFDVPSPLEPGSALALVWRASQEMCGLQGAVAAPQGGGAALADTLIAAAKDMGVEFRTKARVARLVLDGDAMAGVELDSGETIFAPAVLSSLSRRETLLDLAPTASSGFAQTYKMMRAVPAQKETTAVFTLNAEPALAPAGARFVIAEGEPALEAVVAASALPGQHVLSVRAKGLASVDAITAQLERFVPLLRGRIVGTQTGERDVAHTRLLESARSRIVTPIPGLFLCGSGAEPMDALSGRAGRLAADLVMRKRS